MAANNTLPDDLAIPLDHMISHYQERKLYARLVGPLSQNPEQSQWVISLWLWFQSISKNDFIRNVAGCTDFNLLRYFAEGKVCLIGLDKPSADAIGEGDDVDLPLTSFLMATPMNLGFFTFNREWALKGVNQFFGEACKVIFAYPITNKVVRTSHPASSGLGRLMPFGEGTSIPSAAVDAGIPSLAFSADASIPSLAFGLQPFVQMPGKSLLNPSAEPWKPITKFALIDQRSLFLTFSRGYPISRQEIVEFFNKKYGNCVEMVTIEKQMGGSQPLFGRIIFNNISVIPMILNGTGLQSSWSMESTYRLECLFYDTCMKIVD